MIIVDSSLEKRRKDGNPVRVGLVGAGYMGKGMTRQIIESMVGMDVVAIANRTVDRASEVFEACGVGDTVVQASSQAEVDRALRRRGDHEVALGVDHDAAREIVR